ncbi:hypothetical protein [Suttonella ornithocola]|uniref:Uncharacterized protein n=1 Tax=Suttonella ornithocola TaxID=279832 RepID=A0A380MSH1_9GAMM|nr:hypothetical protein [Suttonella ornithocola]SUO95238.1 Uncharacterised protein [Suttonella ornithocola]
MIARLKTMLAWLSAFVLTVVTLGGYTVRQRQRAEQAEREAEQLMINNQAHVAHSQRINAAIRANNQAQAEVDRELESGKRDYFERD